MSEKICVVAGVGPGTGAALSRRFAAGGYRVAMLARDAERLAALEREIAGSRGYAVDGGAADPRAGHGEEPGAEGDPRGLRRHRRRDRCAVDPPGLRVEARRVLRAPRGNRRDRLPCRPPGPLGVDLRGRPAAVRGEVVSVRRHSLPPGGALRERPRGPLRLPETAARDAPAPR